jgi:hypothetical protein
LIDKRFQKEAALVDIVWKVSKIGVVAKGCHSKADNGADIAVIRSLDLSDFHRFVFVAH